MTPTRNEKKFFVRHAFGRTLVRVLACCLVCYSPVQAHPIAYLLHAAGHAGAKLIGIGGAAAKHAAPLASKSSAVKVVAGAATKKAAVAGAATTSTAGKVATYVGNHKGGIALHGGGLLATHAVISSSAKAAPAIAGASAKAAPAVGQAVARSAPVVSKTQAVVNQVWAANAGKAAAVVGVGTAVANAPQLIDKTAEHVVAPAVKVGVDHVVKPVVGPLAWAFGLSLPVVGGTLLLKHEPTRLALKSAFDFTKPKVIAGCQMLRQAAQKRWEDHRATR